MAEIAPETSIQMSEIDQLGPRERDSRAILIAEDSILLSKMIRESLNKAGYTNLSMFGNGRDLWEHLLDIKQRHRIDEEAALIITDIEMPLMDGHRLTKLVKEDPETADIPIVIFSSLVNDEMKRKGEALGANAQLSKPEIGNLVRIIDELTR